MEINEKNNSSLSDEAKKLVTMYITARQFKNAVLKEEMIVIPATKNGLVEGTVIDFGGAQVYAHGNQYISRVFPLVVNKSFSCEVYLKLILLFEGFDLKIIKPSDRHNLESLFKNTSDIFKEKFFSFFSSQYGENGTKEFLEKEIKDISDVFKTWRYIYERLDDSSQVNYGFINVFCDYLDHYSQQLILETYDYDVNKDMR